jgi:tetratricopeptide (TPR) repeat protein
MLAGAPKQSYSRQEVRRVLAISERQLRSWEKQELVPRLDEYAFSDLIALRSLQKLRQNRVPAGRIRRAVRALREKLGGVADPLKELKIVCEGKGVAVLLDGQKMEPVSGQLLLDFDRAELKSLLWFPQDREPPSRAASSAIRQREAEAWFEKGLELEQTGAPLAEVIQAYQRALELDPRSAGALVNLGTIHYHLRKWDEAERCYRQALEVDSGYALAHFNLGNLFDETGDAQRALFHYQAALRVNPNYADAHYNAALLYQSQGDLMRAVRHWKVYLKLDPSSTWASIAKRELDKLCRATVVQGAKAGEDSSIGSVS